MVGGAGEEEGHGCPEGGEGCGAEKADEGALDEDGRFAEVTKDGDQSRPVGDVGVCGGVVRHEEPEEEEDEVLQGEGEPVHVAPVGAIGDDAGEKACKQQTEHEA